MVPGVQLAIPVVAEVLVLHAVWTKGVTAPVRTAHVDEKYGAGVSCGHAVVRTKFGDAVTFPTVQVPGATAVGPLVSGLHAVVRTKFGEEVTFPTVQVPGDTGTSVVTMGAGHVVVMNGLLIGTPDATQVPGATLSVTFMVWVQVVCTWAGLPPAPLEVVPGVQLAKKVGPLVEGGPGQSTSVKLLARLRTALAAHAAGIGTLFVFTPLLHVAR